MSADKMADCT